MTQTIQKLQGIPAPTRKGNKIEGEFYPLQREELIALRRSRLINNAAFVHLALRYENPFCDRPIEIFPKEFAFRWGIPEVSVYKAIGKLKDYGIIKTRSGKVTIEWSTINPDNHSDSDPPPSPPGRRTRGVGDIINSDNDYQNGNKIIKIDNPVSKPITHYQNRKNQPPQPAPEADPSPSQTIQTIQTSQTGGGVENSQSDPVLDLVNKKVDGTEQNYSEEATINEEKQINPKDSGKDQSSASVVQTTTTRVTSQEISPEAKAKKISHEAVDIPEDLISKLKDLGITIDEQVKRTILDHDISQAYGAIKHVENTWETINNPRGVFLFQLPKQRVQKGPAPISEGFLEWYQWAISDGLVIDYPARYLPTNFKGEPKVKLVIDPGWAEDWEKVRDNPDDYRQKLDPTVKEELMTKVRNMLGRQPKTEPEPTLNDQLSDPILADELYPKIKHTHHVDFTESGRPYQATPIVSIKYDENGVPVEEVK